ncbi:MAG TPA: hypothetical protein VGF86_01195 [Candidatus Tumulicola sp.]|jgi:DNA-directed RNA polymerase specialized sigma24 family protein
MAKRLTKETKNGSTYSRPAPVEVNIDGAINQPLEVIRQRLQVVSGTDPDFLTSECIVHLLRQATNAGDEERLAVLHEFLMRRVDRILVSKIRDSDMPNAEEVRLEATYDLDVLIARRSADLDFFEVRFNMALRNLYIPKLRNARQRPPMIPFADQDEDPDRDVSLQETSALSVDIVAAIRSLPPDELEAFMLIEGGYEVESNDPQKTTAATICGVSGRTIRSRQARAKEKLAALLKDHKP